VHHMHGELLKTRCARYCDRPLSRLVGYLVEVLAATAVRPDAAAVVCFWRIPFGMDLIFEEL